MSVREQPRNSQWIGRLVWILALLFLAWASLRLVSRTFDLNLFHQPRLTVTPAILDLGMVPAEETVTTTVEVTNSGGGLLEIAHVKGSCDSCLKISSWPQQKLAGGQSGLIHVSIATGTAASRVRQQALILSNDWTGKPYILIITWTAVARASTD